MSDNDFFKLLDPGQAGNPSSADEIVFRDETGALKVLRNGEITDLDPSSSTTKTTPPPIAANTGTVPSVSLKPAATAPITTPPVLPENPANELNTAVDEAVTRAGVTFPDEQLAKRFRNIVQSRLKGIRNRVQVYETLVEKPAAGGIGLDGQTADRVGVVLNNAYERYHTYERVQVSGEQFSNLQNEVKNILTETIAEKPLRTFAPMSLPASVSPMAPAPIVPPSTPVPTFEKPTRPAVIPSKPVLTPASVIPSPETAGKKKIEDVRYQARLTGPVEEIRTMTLTDFRRLAATPALAIAKVLEKIELLEDESFTRKVEGIRAWKENEINRLYVALGRQSMEEHTPIAEIITARQRASQPTLTEAEVEAVIELNKKLRY